MDVTLFDEREAWIDHEAADLLQERRDAALLDCGLQPCGYGFCAEFGPRYCEHRDAPEQLTLDTRSLEPVKARDLMEEAIEWIGANPQGWVYIVTMARLDARMPERGRVRVKKYLEDMRDWHEIAPGRDGETVKLKNALSAPFGRILAAWYTELAPHIPLHQSKCDGCIVPPAPMWAVKL